MLAYKSRRAGFTLMEILIVAAIIVVLAALAIPHSASALKRTREATCAANRRALKGLFSTEDMLAEQSFHEGSFQPLSAEETKRYPCPSGGTITYSYADGVFTMNCSVHSMIMDDAKDAVIASIRKQETESKTTISSLDSGAVSVRGSYSSKIAGKLTAAGITYNDAKTWRYFRSGTNDFLYWTNEDINTLNIGDTIPVIQYNFLSQHYTVWNAKVREGKLTINGKTSTYKVIGEMSHYKESQKSKPEEQVYKNAAKWLKNAQKALGRNIP